MYMVDISTMELDTMELMEKVTATAMEMEDKESAIKYVHRLESAHKNATTRTEPDETKNIKMTIARFENEFYTWKNV